MIEQPIPKDQLEGILDFLSTLELFKRLKKSILEDLVQSMTYVLLAGGEILIRQGDLDTTMYILLQGRLRVYVQTIDVKSSQEIKSVAEISVGQIVGEIALLVHQPRTGTVRAI